MRTRIRILVLQHPRERDMALSSVPVLAAALDGVVLRVGLSWRSFGAALGEPAMPSQWAVLYLGSGIRGRAEGPIVFVDGKGVPVEAPAAIEGIVALDGTWSEAKAIWWRNPWLLKLRRAVVRPRSPSLYGRIRREPRREATSTLEAVALALTALGERPEVEEALLRAFEARLAIP